MQTAEQWWFFFPQHSEPHFTDVVVLNHTYSISDQDFKLPATKPLSAEANNLQILKKAINALSLPLKQDNTFQTQEVKKIQNLNIKKLLTCKST